MPALFLDLPELDYLQNSLCALVLAAIACGIVGSYVVAQRQSYMIGAVSHSLLGGVGLARYLQVVHQLLWFTPLLGSIGAALCSAVAITLLTRHLKARTDAVLSAIWTLGVALGITFISLTPGYAEDLNSYLFGNILLVSRRDLAVMAAMDAVIVLAAAAFRNRFLAFCFRPETLELRGLSPTATAMLLNILTALTVVLLAQIVGVILALVLLVLPAATAAFITHRLNRMMGIAGLFTLLLSLTGFTLSYEWNLPTGAVIVELTVLLFALAGCFRFLRKKHRPAR